MRAMRAIVRAILAGPNCPHKSQYLCGFCGYEGNEGNLFLDVRKNNIYRLENVYVDAVPERENFFFVGGRSDLKWAGKLPSLPS